MSEESDEEAWKRLLLGDDDAFGLVWRRHFTKVAGRVSRLADGNADVDDLTAMTFLEAWRHGRRVRFVDGSLLPWLLVAAVNIHRNSNRARRRYAHVLARAPRGEYAPDPAQVFEHVQVDPVLTAALKSLTHHERSVLILVALEGYSVKDAAAVAGVKESTARMRLARARARLRTHADVQMIWKEAT